MLTRDFRAWRGTAPRSAERRAVEIAIIQTAGILGHYAADSANPHHTTIHYNGWAGPNPDGYATDCDAHSRFESQFVSHAVTLGDVVPFLSPPARHKDYFATANEFIRASNALTGTLYRIDRDEVFSHFGPVS